MRDLSKGLMVRSPPSNDAEGEPRDRPFNPWRRPATDRANAVVNDVRNQLERFDAACMQRKRKRRPADQRTFEETVAAIVSDLTHRHLTAVDAWIAIPLSNQTLGRRIRYRSPVLSKKLPEVVSRMAKPEMDWLQMRIGYSTPFGPGRQTTIRSGPRLLTRIEEHGLTVGDFTRLKTEEAIILKSTRTTYWDENDWVDYDDTPQTRRYRKELARINDWLEQGDITCEPWAAPPGHVIDASDRRLRRYFNNGSFELGGRLFGGFWQNLASEHRLRAIRINGEPVVGVDFGQMNPRLLYWKAGLQAPPDDAYEIPPLRAHRDGIKTLFNAMLYRDAVKKFPKGTRHWFPARYSVGEAAELIRTHHAPVAHLFGSGIGFELLFVESEILVEVLLQLMDRRIVALPLHDAVIVAQPDAETAETVMLESFRRHTGFEAVVKSEQE